jgi:hypothetical protein
MGSSQQTQLASSMYSRTSNKSMDDHQVYYRIPKTTNKKYHKDTDILLVQGTIGALRDTKTLTYTRTS